MVSITTTPLDYWVHHISQYLSEKEEESRLNSVEELIRSNDRLLTQKGEIPHHGFIYNGLMWRVRDQVTVQFTNPNLPPLDKTLAPAMDKILEQSTKAQLDFIDIRQGLVILLAPCFGDKQKALNTLPDFISDMIPKQHFEDIERTESEPLSTISSNPTKLAQWEKVEALIHYYSAMRLIYQ